MPKQKTIFHWSSGKDSAIALYHSINDPNVEIEHLLTTINSQHQRVTMHGTPIELVLRQISTLEIPYSITELPLNPSMEAYESIINGKLIELKNVGMTHAAYGDIFLQDLRDYREKQLQKIGLKSNFPIWKRDTKELLKEFIDLGFRAIIVSANEQLGESFLGRELDHAFISDLPNDIDPCGENGEFHTFCFDGPIFSNPIKFATGKKTKRSYPNPNGVGETFFWFQDLLT
ncbi:MAG: diphthine--ammonia ligase [Ekhidna sp.]|nr:diphthine--ammonia ligase [Ekhidna sp.]